MTEKEALREIKDKIDSIDTKLDSFLERIAAAETWIKSGKITIGFVITTGSALFGYLILK
jgi:hypothetical protein